jgi:parallel beta-helix repeat protein
VSGTCNESVVIDAEFSRITLDGRGSATVQSATSGANVILIRGREITVKGFTLRGGNNGILVQRGSGTVDGNTILSNAHSGIVVGPQGAASIINNTIENNQTGITVENNSSARIGFQVPTVLGLPNTIQNNADHGIEVLRSSNARIIGATIRNNGGDGVRIERVSHADITDNSISGNVGNGITVSENSGVEFDLGRIQAVAPPNRTDSGMNNRGFGIACWVGAYVSGSLGTLTGAKGVMNADNTCVQDVGPLVSGLSLNPVNVSGGGTFTAIFSGTGLSAQTYFDIRFRPPGGNTDQEVFNWQQGMSATHSVPGSTETGAYVVTAARAHNDIADHTGPYIPVSASLIVP